MHKHKYYKPPKPSTLPQKPINHESRPQFTTDFTDPDKYKLSQLQMIQKKASLQSKNREIAKHDLEERRKKLQMGIIDEETRKIFQTALISKNIDLNPNIRRNLSQMIQYERERSVRKNSRGSVGKSNKSGKEIRDDQNSQEQNQSADFQGEIKKTQHFIKKLQKAKKQQNIGKAINILLDDKKSTNFGPTKSMTNILTNQSIKSQSQSQQNASKNSNINIHNDNVNVNVNANMMGSRMTQMSQEQTLSNIQETIKFMEEKLFNPNWNKNGGKDKSKDGKGKEGMDGKRPIDTFEQRKNQGSEAKLGEDIKCSTISQISHDMTNNQFISGFHSGRQNGMLNTNIFGSPSSDFLKNNDHSRQQSFDMDGQLQALRLNFNKNTQLPNFAANPTISNQSNKYPNSNLFPYRAQPQQQQHQDQDDCIQTIRKMKDMMQSKMDIYDNSQCRKQKQNKNNYNSQRSQKSLHELKSEGDAEVDFSLTLNQDEIQQNNSFVSANFQKNNKYNKNVENSDRMIKNVGKIQKNGYEEMKRSLFDEIDKLEQETKNIQLKGINNRSINVNNESDEQCSYEVPIQYQFKKQTKQPKMSQISNNKVKYDYEDDEYQVQIKNPFQNAFNTHASNMNHNTYTRTNIDQKPNSNGSNTYTISSSMSPIATTTTTTTTTNINKYPQLQVSSITKDLQQLKSMVQGTRKNVNSINIQKSQHSTTSNNSNGMMGFDYRGSINIKKHVVRNQD